MFLKQGPSCLVCQGLKVFKSWGYGDEQAYESECLEGDLGAGHTLGLHKKHTLSSEFCVGVDEWLEYWRKRSTNDGMGSLQQTTKKARRTPRAE